MNRLWCRRSRHLAGAPRRYKYYPSAAAQSTPLFEFGHGLSLTTFSMTCDADPQQPLSYTCTVTNTGTRAGDEVVMVYHSAGAARAMCNGWMN